MQQTATEWLFEKLWETPIDKFSWYALLEKAKEMQKEQLIQSYSNGWHDGQDAIIEKIEHIDKGGDELGNKYYQETYNNHNQIT